ncbi:anti-sigma factor antagonist [Mycolicibacterium vaccae]|nr:STAS domain-containing protein [Mycolicibacterium vaccae]MCV7063384.1 anti-sigma factor antagonist [Mycolicibacterium vaccae]
MREPSAVGVTATPGSGGNTTLTMAGTLDDSTYRQVRDSVISAALAVPTAVLVDVSALRVPADSGWTAFTSARWHVSTWPGVPVLLVCDDPAGRAAIARCGAARFVPVHPDPASAVAATGAAGHPRRRVAADLEGDRDSLPRVRKLVARWLTRWDRPQLVHTASTVASVFVENVLEHTADRPRLVLEATDDRVTVAVSDGSPDPAVRQEDSVSGAHTVSGLAIVAALSRSWGSTPAADGKTVWAVLGPENRL